MWNSIKNCSKTLKNLMISITKMEILKKYSKPQVKNMKCSHPPLTTLHFLQKWCYTPPKFNSGNDHPTKKNTVLNPDIYRVWNVYPPEGLFFMFILITQSSNFYRKYQILFCWSAFFLEMFTWDKNDRFYIFSKKILYFEEVKKLEHKAFGKIKTLVL